MEENRVTLTDVRLPFVVLLKLVALVWAAVFLVTLGVAVIVGFGYIAWLEFGFFALGIPVLLIGLVGFFALLGRD